MTSNGSIDIFELACGIKVPVNKNELVETINKLDNNDTFQTAMSFY